MSALGGDEYIQLVLWLVRQPWGYRWRPVSTIEPSEALASPKEEPCSPR